MTKISVDLIAGVPADSLRNGESLEGKAGDDDVLLVRDRDRWFAEGAHCTHYHGPLAEGLIVDGTVRCPWHHACFDLKSGDAVRAPALDSLPCWRVEQRDGRVFVRERMSPQVPSGARSGDAAGHPSSIVIIGGGAAGLAAADMLRREGYAGPITMISADHDAPVDRPNLSKDYLAGEAKDEWIPMWPSELYGERQVTLRLATEVTGIEPAARTLQLGDGSRIAFGAALIATGADPVRLPMLGDDGGRIHYLRSFADSRAIVERATAAKHVVVVGASFIGLEVAASLSQRGIAIDVVAPEAVPLERIMGPEIGRFVQSLHEAHGVSFHLGETVKAVDGRAVSLSGGGRLDADFVVMGVGVRPSAALAERAGLSIDRGIAVDEFLETSVRGIFAAGDVARWPDPHSGERIRVEHWVVAQRQGQTAARNMLGRREPFDAVPFFWSQHYDVTIRYVGHAERWDKIAIDGSLDDRNAIARFVRNGKTLAVATISRDRENLLAEVAFERG